MAISKLGDLQLLVLIPPLHVRDRHGSPQKIDDWIFVPKPDRTRYDEENRQLLVQRDNRLLGTVDDLAPLGGASGCFRLKLRLKDG
jgi:hypothetical protein